jgi:hypothetical protein
MCSLLSTGKSSDVERAKHAAELGGGLTLPNAYCREKVGQRKAILH